MSILIHMLNVGDADAIIVQLNDHSGSLSLLVDGGETEDHADRIISYFNNELKTIPYAVICTHLHDDHIKGLIHILQYYKNAIKSVWTHIPSRHETSFKTLLTSILIEKKAFGLIDKRLELILASVQNLETLEQVAQNLGIRISEPFSDDSDSEIITLCARWNIEILGPSTTFYSTLVPLFRKSYLQKIYALEIAKAGVNPCSLIGKDGEDNPENESSLIFRITNNDKSYLFTGDAGLKAFKQVEEKLNKTHWVKIPHHGSKKNLNFEIITRLKPDKCFISAVGKDGHPDINLKKCLGDVHHAEVECTGEKNSDIHLEE